MLDISNKPKARYFVQDQVFQPILTLIFEPRRIKSVFQKGLSAKFAKLILKRYPNPMGLITVNPIKKSLSNHNSSIRIRF